MTMTGPKVAVIGCGYWGKNLVRNFQQIGALAMVCDPTPAGRKLAGELAPGVEIGDSLDAALTRDDIAAVVVATPAETHRDLVLRALEAGKDVLVEKPLALNYIEGQEMQAAAEARERILMVGHLLEYHSAVLRLRKLVDEKVLGRVNYIYSNRLNFGKVRVEENSLWSFAPHDIAVILRLVGELPIEVTCCGGNYISPNVEDVTVSCLHFRTGLRAHIFVNWLNPFKEQKLVVVGDDKMAVFNDVEPEEKLVLFNQRVKLEGGKPVLYNGDRTVVDLEKREPLRQECEHFLECVRDRRAPLTDAAAGVRVLKVLQACQTSLQLNGRPVVMSEI